MLVPSIADALCSSCFSRLLFVFVLAFPSGEDTFGQPKLINTLDRPLWERPQNVALSSYLALPMTAAAGKPVLRLGMDVTDELTDYSVGGFFKSAQTHTQGAVAFCKAREATPQSHSV